MYLEARVETMATDESVIAVVSIGTSTITTLELPWQERGVVYLHETGEIAIAQRDFDDIALAIYRVIAMYENDGVPVLLWGVGRLNHFNDKEGRPIIRAPRTYVTQTEQKFKRALAEYIYA